MESSIATSRRRSSGDGGGRAHDNDALGFLARPPLPRGVSDDHELGLSERLDRAREGRPAGASAPGGRRSVGLNDLRCPGFAARALGDHRQERWYPAMTGTDVSPSLAA